MTYDCMDDKISLNAAVSRRQFLSGAAMFGAAVTICPGLVLAQARTDERLVVIILRGGMDGLAAVAPYGDPSYASTRNGLALNSDTILKMDQRFAFHPSLAALHKMYQNKEVAVIHAAASPYRERSHFDGQNILELGSTTPYALHSGWLNRTIGAINARDSSLAISLGTTAPTIIRGTAPYQSWSPNSIAKVNDDFMSLLKMSYAQDKRFSDALNQGLMARESTSDAVPKDEKMNTKQGQSFPILAEKAGQFLAKETGPRLATLEMGGWDTHIQQGTEGGRLSENLEVLNRGIEALKSSLGPAWSKTTIVAMTEFGRTAHMNGNRGTDHGTASVVLLMGGRVQGGIYGDWPGLADANLYQNRDLMPTTDIRSIMKGVLNNLYGLSPATLDNDIYPGSGNARSMTGLIRV